jgi:hypothetical protein
MLSRLYKLDHLYGLLLTFGLRSSSSVFRNEFGSSGLPYQIPVSLPGASIWASCSCPIPRVGHRRVTHCLSRYMVRD